MASLKWQKARAKKISNMKWPKTRRGWLARWKKSLIAVRDKATDLWEDRETYNEYREIVLANPDLDKSAEFFHLVDRMYLSHVLTAIRTFDDTDFRSHSLFNLLEEIRNNVAQLSKAWFVGRFKRRPIGERQFTQHWSGNAHVSAQRVADDLRMLTKLCRRVRTVVNKHLAHNARRRQKISLTYGELNEAIDGIFQLVSRYSALITGASWGTPAGFSSRHVFEIPWLAPRR
jgi:hypothetical protein